MLKIGTQNYIGSSVVSATSTSTGRNANMIKDPTITSWAAEQKDVTVSISLVDSGFSEILISAGESLIEIGEFGEVLGSSTNSIEMASLHRVNYTGTLTVESFYVGELIESKVFSQGDSDGVEVFSLDLGLSGIINRIDLKFAGGNTNPSIGYVFIGSQISFKTTASQDKDESGDIASITQGGYAGSSRRPILRKMTVTLAHEESGAMKSKIRQILKDGFSKPRPVIRTEECRPTESMLAILDSNVVAYDIFNNKDENRKYKSQATIGFSEVLGGIS